MFLSVETTITNFALEVWFLKMESMRYGLYDKVMHCECPHETLGINWTNHLAF
jgi:hypothetical protein